MHLLLSEYCCVQSSADPVGRALLDEGWGMLRALVEDLSRAWHRLTVLANPILESRLRSYPGVEVVLTEPEEELDHLTRYAPRSEGVMVIAPEFHGLLEERVRLVLAAGGRSLNVAPNLLHVLADKLAVSQSVPSPVTARWSPDLAWSRFPTVVKPVNGAGSQGVRVVQDETELLQAVAEVQAEGWTDLIVQPRHSGLSASICLLTGQHGQVCPATEQLLTDDGRMHYLGARYPLSSELQNRAHRLLEAAKVLLSPDSLGWIGLDVGLSPDGKDILFDINPRLTTSYLALRQRCRNNLADAMIRIAVGEKLPPLEWDPAPLEFRVGENV
jgi:predicted ATP-grasp superfamily ATP-dependent carboligase